MRAKLFAIELVHFKISCSNSTWTTRPFIIWLNYSCLECSVSWWKTESLNQLCICWSIWHTCIFGGDGGPKIMITRLNMALWKKTNIILDSNWACCQRRCFPANSGHNCSGPYASMKSKLEHLTVVCTLRWEIWTSSGYKASSWWCIINKKE